MSNICDFITNSNIAAILCLDSNGHSPLWNCSESCSRGTAIEELIFQYNISVLNRGHRPTFVNSRGHSSIIDLTLTLGKNEDIQNWHVCEEYHFSDHRMIEFSADFKASEFPKFKKINWEHFSKVFKVSDYKHHLWCDDVIEKEASSFETAINSALQLSTHLQKRKQFTPKWMNADLLREKRRVIKLEHTWWKNKTLENREAFNSAQKSFRKMTFRAKRRSWQDFCNSIEDPKNMALLNKVLKKGPREQIGLLKKPDGSHTTTPIESIHLL